MKSRLPILEAMKVARASRAFHEIGDLRARQAAREIEKLRVRFARALAAPSEERDHGLVVLDGNRRSRGALGGRVRIDQNRAPIPLRARRVTRGRVRDVDSHSLGARRREPGALEEARELRPPSGRVHQEVELGARPVVKDARLPARPLDELDSGAFQRDSRARQREAPDLPFEESAALQVDLDADPESPLPHAEMEPVVARAHIDAIPAALGDRGEQTGKELFERRSSSRQEGVDVMSLRHALPQTRIVSEVVALEHDHALETLAERASCQHSRDASPDDRRRSHER